MSYNKTKTDPVLGQQVHDHLVSLGVETPVINNGLSRTEKIEKIDKNSKHIIAKKIIKKVAKYFF